MMGLGNPPGPGVDVLLTFTSCETISACIRMVGRNARFRAQEGIYWACIACPCEGSLSP